MRVATKKAICQEHLKNLLNISDYNSLYENLNSFVSGLWSNDQLTDDSYDEMKDAIQTCFKNNKLLKETSKIVEVQYRFLPRNNSQGIVDIEYLDKKEWKFAHYFHKLIWDFEEPSAFWEGLEESIEEDGYKGYTWTPTPKYRDAEYKVLEFKKKKWNPETYTGGCIAKVEISNIH